MPEFWAALSIVTMWFAVLFDGIFGSDMTFDSSTGIATIPSAVMLALFAGTGTSAAAKRGFGRKGIE